MDPDTSEHARDMIVKGYIEQVLSSQSVSITLLGFEHEIYEQYEIGLMYKYAIHGCACLYIQLT